MSYTTSELQRQMQNLVRVATVSKVDYANKCLRIKAGDLESNWLPHPCHMGRNFIVWQPIRIGTQVIIACPSGDLAQAVIIGQLYQDNFQPPSTSPHIDTVKFNDGTQMTYNSDEKVLTLNVVGDVKVITKGKADINVGTDCTLTTGGNTTAIVGGDCHIKTTGNTTATVGGELNVTSKGNTTITAPLITYISGKGVVTGECICPFTGNPFPDYSTRVKAAKT